MTQEELAAIAGAVGRTLHEWEYAKRSPSDEQLRRVVRFVHAADPAMAARIAVAGGATLESLGVGPRPAGVLTPIQAAELFVSAAADALDLSPRAVRPAMAAALQR